MHRTGRAIPKLVVGTSILVGCGSTLTITMGEDTSDDARNDASAADANGIDTGSPPIDDRRYCARRGCGSTFHVAIPNFDPSALPDRRLTFCVNAVCYSIEVSFLGGPPQSGIGLPVRTASGSPVSSEIVSAFYWNAPQAGSTCTGAIFALWYRTEFAHAQDGDRYTLTVDKADGGDAAAPFEFSTTATYEVTYPNGAQCSPACKQTSVGCLL